MNLKKQALRFMGSEEYDILAELLNGQLEQMERMSKTLGSGQEVERFNAEKLEKAVNNSSIDEVTDVVLSQFNNRMRKLQIAGLKAQNIDEDRIISEYLEEK